MNGEVPHGVNPEGIPSAKPRVARNELPWVDGEKDASTLKGLRPMGVSGGRNPFRVENAICLIPQGSSFLATLGFAGGIPSGFISTSRHQRYILVCHY